MILLDFVGDRDLSIPREANSDPDLWAQLRSAAKRVGHGGHFPAGDVNPMLDDHIPFTDAGRPVDRPDRLHLRLLPPTL